MSSFVPTNYNLRTALVFCYHLKKTAAESHRMLVKAYDEHALGKTQCFEWFKKFKSGNFDVRNEDRGKPPKKYVWWDQKGVIYYELLKPGETVNTNRYQQQMIDLNRKLQEKRPDYRRRQHKVIFFTIMPHHKHRNGSRKRSRRSVGKYWRMPLILQTCLRRITICSHHWATLSLNNASLCTKMYENGSITGLI